MYATTIVVSILAAVQSAAAVAVNSNSPRGLVTSCNPPTSPSDSTYGLCAYPNSEAARSSLDEVKAYMTNHAGCGTISGNGAGVVLGFGCGGPGPDPITAGVPGWSINSSFNPAACLPGDMCD